ncbi:MAG TPA: hypothetical protein VHE61_02980 [Opitutaceae bacterium]|nr:hypothetical protein [Opitutaceae bacterium]
MTEAQIAAVAGEHYVAHKIAMLGFVPTLVRQRMPRIDLLVSSGRTSRTVGIQIKSTFNAMREPESDTAQASTFDLRFPLGHRAITSSAGAAFFCFVDLRRLSPSAPPDVYVVPAPVLRREYEGVYLRRYSQLHYQRPWQALQPFRNNWESLVEALTTTEEAAPVTPVNRTAAPFEGLARRWRNGLVLIGDPSAAQ